MMESEDANAPEKVLVSYFMIFGNVVPASNKYFSIFEVIFLIFGMLSMLRIDFFSLFEVKNIS